MVDPKDLPEVAPPKPLPPFPHLPGVRRDQRRVSLATVQMSPGAECEECNFAVVPKPSALAEAIEHAQETGHSVFVDEITRTSVEVL